MRPVNRDLLALETPSDEILRRIGYWLPQRGTEIDWRRRRPNSTLRIATLTGTRLWQGLGHEAQVYPLTPRNWKLVLGHGGVDLLLVESCRESVTGHWRLAQSGRAPESALLAELVDYARGAGLPRVYWNTCDVAWLDHYRAFARDFDHVFCADPLAAEALRREGIAAGVLQPAVQPAVFTPVRGSAAPLPAQFRLLYDGIVDLFRPRPGAQVLRRLKGRGIAAIDSHARVFGNRLLEQKRAVRVLPGCVIEPDRLSALRGARVALTLGDSHLTPTEQRWQALEIAACRVPIVHHGRLDESDPRRGLVVEAPDEAALLGAIAELQADDLKRERVAHLNWRRANTEHALAGRLAELCRAAGIAHAPRPAPRISVVTPTFRPNRLAECIANFDRQDYPDKELLIVFNGEPDPAWAGTLLGGRGDVRILGVPRERHTGACMNAGIAAAHGEYCFKMDDDDIYGARYVSDMMLHALALDADILGKPSRYYVFGEAPELHQRIGARSPELCRVSAAELASADAWMSGNSIAGRREALLAAPFPDALYSAADTAFVMGLGNTELRVAILDALNLVTVRGTGADHTWNAQARLQSRLQPVAGTAEGVLL